MLRQVELPLASPLIMAGIRTSAVAVIATATLARVRRRGRPGPVHHRRLRDQLRRSAHLRRRARSWRCLSIVVELVLGLVQRFIVPQPLRWTVEHARCRDAAT